MVVLEIKSYRSLMKKTTADSKSKGKTRDKYAPHVVISCQEKVAGDILWLN